jgi:hypothetical protein
MSFPSMKMKEESSLILMRAGGFGIKKQKEKGAEGIRAEGNRKRKGTGTRHNREKR